MKNVKDGTEKGEREIGATGSCRNGLFGMNEKERKFSDSQA